MRGMNTGKHERVMNKCLGSRLKRMAAALVIIVSISSIFIICHSRATTIVNSDSYLIDSFFASLRGNVVLVNEHMGLLTSVDISKHYDALGNHVYLAKVTPQFAWASSLYFLDIEGITVAKITDTGLAGNSKYFLYDVVNMTQGTYVRRIARHIRAMGTWSLCLLMVLVLAST